MPHQTNKPSIKITNFPETRVAVFEYRGSIELLDQSIAASFIPWRKTNVNLPKDSALYNVMYMNKEDHAINVESECTKSNKFGMDVCVAIDCAVQNNAYGILEKKIPANRCAVLRHTGNDDHLKDSIDYLYTQWLPESGEALGEYPCFFHRVNYASTHQDEMITDIYLPLK